MKKFLLRNMNGLQLGKKTYFFIKIGFSEFQRIQQGSCGS